MTPDLILAGSLTNPVAPWIFEYVFSAVGVALGVVLLIRSARRRRFLPAALIFLSAITMFWQEFYADWGAYLLYTDRFHLMPWKSALTSPNKPWFMLIAYGWYFTIIYTAIPFLIERTAKRLPRLPRWAVVILIAVPFFYLWDAVVEFSSVAMGYWTYVNTIGPALDFNGTRVSLVHPLELFTFYGVIMSALLVHRDDGGRPRFEGLLGAHRQPPGTGAELRRLGAWILTMNGVYWFAFTLWILVVRSLSGAENPLVP
jgi:hypothetical protein